MSVTAPPDPNMNLTDVMADNDFPTNTYPLAILIAIFALAISFLIFPPMIWHARNRNIGATSLIFWILILNLQTLINAIIWRTDNIPSWWDGAGLCDIEVKIQVASEVGFPSSAACVLKALARVMDTDKVTLSTTKAQRRRSYAIDILWCVGFPLLQMFFHYIVQTKRYYIYGISGCVPPVSKSWVRDLLMTSPPVIWTLICAFYAGLVLIRLHRYRRNFTTLLAHSSTNKSRFMRLFLICLAWVIISVPLETYVVAQQASTPHQPFVWSEVHDPAVWNDIEMVPTNGSVIYVRYIWLGAGVCVFLFFGFGRDAMRMYAQGLRAVGFAKCFPSLDAKNRSQTSTRAASVAGTFTSVSSKVKLLFARKSVSPIDSQKTWSTDSRSFNLTSSADAEPLSPRTNAFLDTVCEEPQQLYLSGKKPRLSTWLRGHTTPKFQKPAYDTDTERGGARIAMNEVVRQNAAARPSDLPESNMAKEFETPPGIYVKKEIGVSSESA